MSSGNPFGTTHGIEDATEFDNAPVARPFDDAAVMGGDCRIDQVAAQGPEPSENAILVRACQPAVADFVGHKNSRKLSQPVRFPI
jgi:hypothetical protein